MPKSASQNLGLISDPNIAYNALIDELTDSIDHTIPEKFIKRGVPDKKLWLTKGILKSINKKNKLYKCYINNPNDTNKELYKIQK